MEYISLITTVVVALLGSGIIQWAFNRKDSKNDRIKEVERKIDTLSKGLDDVITEAGRREAESIRRHILDFADQCRMGRDRSYESFVVALDDCKKYEEYCKSHDTFVNGKTEMSISQTREMFSKKFPMEVKR